MKVDDDDEKGLAQLGRCRERWGMCWISRYIGVLLCEHFAAQSDYVLTYIHV